MTEPRDPIDDWLGADVELLRPRPGAFDRIHRTARRRKATRAVSTLAGVAVVVAAAVTVPLAGLFPGQGGQPNVIAGKKTSSSTPSRSPKAGSPSPSPSASPRQSGPQPGAVALGSTGQTHPAASDFRPTSITFVGLSGGVVGAVIGQANCPSGSCTSVAGTPDYGRTWYRMGAPPAGSPNGAQGVGQIRFADASDGWAYGPQLYATHDGGLHWREVMLAGRVIDLAAMSGQAFAVLASGCTGKGPNYAANCSSYAMWSSPASSDRWRLVRGTSTGIAAAPGGLQLTSQHGYLMTKGLIYAGPVAAGAWHPVHSAGASCLMGGRFGPWLLAPGSPELFLVCARPRPAGSLALYRSSDMGVNWQDQGLVVESGTPLSLAIAPTSGWLVLATSTGIFYSTDQKTWLRASLTGAPAGGFGYIGMTTTLTGVAVPANPGLREIFTTGDGGRTWQPLVLP